MDPSDNGHDVGEDEHSTRYLTMKIIERGCPELQELDALRKKGWEDEALKTSLDTHNANARRATDTPTNLKKADEYWFQVSKGVIWPLITRTRLFHSKMKVDRFLDLGCCPGGFSYGVLREFRKAQGVGVSLEVAAGGHGLEIPLPYLARFEIHWGDLTYFDICAPVSAPAAEKTHIVSTPFDCRRDFQLAILDGHHRRTQESDETHKWDIDRLLLAQLIIALESLELGGVLVVTLKRIELPKMARILYMLDELSTGVDMFKLYGPHRTRSMFYAVVRGVGQGQEGLKRDFYVQRLKDLWWECTFGGQSGEGRWVELQDLDFIVDMETLATTYLDRLIHLGREIWGIQRDGLKAQFEKHEKYRRRRVAMGVE